MQGTPKKFIQVVQPGEDSFALAIVVDATGRAGEAPRFPVGKEAEGPREGGSSQMHEQLACRALSFWTRGVM